MSWKERLGTKGNFVFNEEIDTYLLNLGFYYDTMNPRFMNGYNYSQLKLNKRVLRFDGDNPNDREGVQRVFLNRIEIYIERQTNYRSFDGSDYKNLKSLEEPITIELLDSILNELI